MLPTSGYFRGIGCPGHEKGHCNRPYCHFHHSSKKESSSATIPPKVSSVAEIDKSSGQMKAKSKSPVKVQSVEDSPSCSNTETPSLVSASLDNQSEILQQLVSEAVKKVLIENPHLTSVGVDPSTIIAQTTAEVSPVNSSSKKKYYPRPPDTPSYNPTPIRELNKRKRSSDGHDDLPSKSKAAKYVPASLSHKNIISDANENKESGDSEATDFSSPEDEDLDQRNCDFDILEEVLAEHSQNNKIKVKKKKVKALGKLQYNLSNHDKKVDESSMISDAQTISDQDSNTCDGPKDKPKEFEEPASAGSYFLPPSPIFTSSSDGFGAYNTLAYSMSETNDEEDGSDSKNNEDETLVESLQESDKSIMKEKDTNTTIKLDQNKAKNCVSKSVSKGHALLPKFVLTLGAPKMSRPSVRSWNPQSRNSTATVTDAGKDSNSDPLEAMLQQMDGDQIAQKDAENAASDVTHPVISSPKNSKKYKVDLDKEIKSLTSSPSVNNDRKERIVDKGTRVTGSVNEEKKGGREVNDEVSVSGEKSKKKDSGGVTPNEKESSKVVPPKEKQKKVSESSESKSEKGSIDERSSCSKKSHDEDSEEDAIAKEKKLSDEIEVERDSRKKKRKRERSSGSESHDSYSRKKRKKSHKRRKKYKKRRRRKNSRSESEEEEESDVGSVKDEDGNDEDDEKEDKDKLNSSEAEDKEGEKSKKHKKRKKKSRHRKKSKHRRRSKNKMRKRNRSRSQSGSLSSSQDRSRSTSKHRSSSRQRSRSSSRHRSRSHDRHTSRSDSGRRSSSRHRSGTNSRSRSRSYRSRSKTKHRSRSNSRLSSRSNTKHRSRSKSRSRSQSQKKTRHSSQNHSTSRERENQEARHRKDIKSRSHSTKDSVTGSKNDKVNSSVISTPMPVDPSKIKLEKDAVPAASSSVIVPDLSIVKKEKEEDIPSIPCTSSIKVERSKSQIEDQQNLKSNRKAELLSSTNSVEKPAHSHEERKGLNNTHSKRESSSSHLKLPKETNSQDSQQKVKEHSKDSETKEGRKSSNSERRSSSESISNQKTSRRSSAELKKTEKEHTSSKALPNERRISTEKNKDGVVNSSNKESQPGALSIFDMVLASIEPSKPKALKEISLFDKVSAVGYESSSDSPPPSDLESLDASHESKDKSASQRKSLSHSISREKSSSDAKTEKPKSQSKSDKDEHPHKSSSSHSKSKSHKEEVSSKHSHSLSSASKHSHSSSSKHKSSTGSSHHHSSSHSHKSSTGSSTNKSSTPNKALNDGSDAVGSPSGKSSHSLSSKNKEAKSSSHSSSKQDLSQSSKSSHNRKLSTSSVDKEKEHNSTTAHKSSRDHSKKSSGKEKEQSSSSNHHHHHSSSKGRESGKDGIESKKDHKQKESTKSRHDKQKEVSSGKKSTNKQSLRVDEDVSSSSDRELYGANDDDDGDDDDEGVGNNSPFPDLSALDEIPQDDWEQLINSSGDDLKHLETLRSEEDFDLEDLDKDDPDIMEECLQMYNDFKPDPADGESQVSSKKKTKAEPKQEAEPLSSKQRIARTSSGGNMLAPKPNAELRNRKKTPAQVMMERYQRLKDEQAELLKQLERQKQQLEEQGRGVASGAVSSTTSSRSKPGVVSSSNVSSTTPSRSKIAPASSTSMKASPHSTTGVPKRRMSHVPNVSSLLQAKEKIKNLQHPRSKSGASSSAASASGSLPQTIAHTVAKGEKRFAHTPKLETLQRPSIAPEFGSKVPPNIRQRYLNSLIDECLKFLSEKEAFNLGLAEERVCFQRASSRMVYLNLAVNAVKRLRNQQEAGEAAQELLDTDPMFKDNNFSEDASSSEKPSTSGISASPSREVKKQKQQHPINPNHSRLSHFSVLAVGGQRGSWSIEKPKKSTVDVQNCLKGMNFYNYIKKYILSEDQLGDHGFPFPDPDEKGKAIVKTIDTRKKLSPSSVERYCDRCSTLYKVDKWGFPLSIGPCVHHWGRAYKRRGYSGMETRYSCCSGDPESDGCCQATTHVSHNYEPNKLRGYVRTLPKDVKNNDYGVYALDCEMSYTTAGNELTRVTVIDIEGNTVYEQLVKPENPIIDYNTRFSGITESDMEEVKTTIRDVQASMLTRFSDKTILIGHSLESDFHALKLIHDTVIDTSVVFPHKMGAPFKRALRNLASEYLKKIIQNDVSGHDSAEDAITCMHLMQWRVKEDLKGFGQK